MNDKHWVFKKHTNNLNLLVEVALYLKANKSGISMNEKSRMYERFSNTNLYNPRKSLRDEPLDAINHKLDGLSYFMFGYSDVLEGNKKFIFSPLGNLFLKYLDKPNELAKIFSTMLIGMQFPHPSSRPSENFGLYPFRLIFSLLLDKRLNGILYHYEVYRYLIHIDQIDQSSYSELVDELLASRLATDDEKFAYLKENEYSIVKSIYEWQYYISSLLESANIIEKNSGSKSIELFHPKREGSISKPTKRIVNNGFFKLTDVVKLYIDEIINMYSPFDKPLSLFNSKNMSSDVIKEIYSFYPIELLQSIGEEVDSVELGLLELPKLIEEYSMNPENLASDKFEDILEEAFNLFVNVEAHKLSGAGRTDIECLYIDIKEKFAVEAKSTSNKLIGINAGRLRRHRDIIGARYTIVVTPRYVPSVKYDIQEQNIVIIKANTLSEYLYNHIATNNREIDYGEIQDIVVNNLGKDISYNISELTLAKFG